MTLFCHICSKNFLVLFGLFGLFYRGQNSIFFAIFNISCSSVFVSPFLFLSKVMLFCFGFPFLLRKRISWFFLRFRLVRFCFVSLRLFVGIVLFLVILILCCWFWSGLCFFLYTVFVVLFVVGVDAFFAVILPNGRILVIFFSLLPFSLKRSDLIFIVFVFQDTGIPFPVWWTSYLFILFVNVSFYSAVVWEVILYCLRSYLVVNF